MSFNDLVKAQELISKLNSQRRYLLCFGGTTEGRLLCETELDMIYSVVSEFGKDLIIPREHLIISQGIMLKDEIVKLLSSGVIYAVVDASHPFARSISPSIKEACEKTNIPLARFSRTSEQLSFSPNSSLIYFSSLDELVAEFKRSYPDKRVFVSSGVKSLKALADYPSFDKMRIRIIPSEESRKLAQDAGLREDQIISKTGPFSLEDNLRDFEGSELLITKESGERGGFKEKIEAAQRLNMISLIISRPKDLDYTNSFTSVEEIIAWARALKKD